MKDWTHPAGERSCRRDYDPLTGPVREVMPTDAAARPEEYSDNCTQAAGSQFRCVHDGCLQQSAPVT
jgi:hypothetical protein